MNRNLILSIALLIVLILSACGSASSGEGAAQAIETYLTALVEKDAATLVNTSCATWEEGALTDSRAYDGVTARLEGMACAVDSSDGEYTLVSCSGNIIATYSGEDRPLPLDTRQYLAVEEGGEWRMCGYR